jgi:Tfp pilus tip-associated adhesin PilY1
MGTTPVYFVRKNSGSPQMKEFFTGDSEGNILYCDMEKPVEDWKLRNIFQVRAARNKAVALPIAFEIVNFSNAGRWLFGGAANVLSPMQEFVGTGGSVRRQRALRNDEQFIFGLRISNMNATYPTDRDVVTPKGMSDLTRLNYEIQATGTGVKQPDVGEYGWYLRLREAISSGSTPTEAEYVSGSPLYNPDNNTLYVATYTAYTENPNDQERCRDTGFAKLYALNPTTGASKWEDGKQAQTFRNVKIVGMSSYTRDINGKPVGSIFLGVKPLGGEPLSSFPLGSLTHADGSIVEVNVEVNPPANVPDLTPIVPHLQYWREMF